MRASIQATNVVLNLAIVPNVILMPSNFVILDKKIEGYNNILTTATEEMSFGINKNVNYSKPKPKPNSKPKPDGLLDNYFHNDVNNGRGNSSNDNNDDDGDDGVLFRKGKTDRASAADRSRPQGGKWEASGSGLGLSIVFFLSMAVGVFTFKKIFS